MRDRVDRFTVFLHRHQHRRRRKITVPDVVVDALKVPDALSGLRIQRKFAVGEQVVANAVSTVKIEGRRTCRYVNYAGFLIERHPGPIVYAAAFLPGIFRPGVVTELARMWNGMKDPALLSGVNVVGTDVAGKCGQGFRQAATNYKEVFVNHRRTGERYETRRNVAPESFAKIDSSVSSESWNGFAGLGVEFVNEVHYADNDAAVLIVSAGPISKSTSRLRTDNSGVEFPLEFAVRSIDGEYFL